MLDDKPKDLLSSISKVTVNNFETNYSFKNSKLPSRSVSRSISSDTSKITTNMQKRAHFNCLGLHLIAKVFDQKKTNLSQEIANANFQLHFLFLWSKLNINAKFCTSHMDCLTPKFHINSLADK